MAKPSTAIKGFIELVLDGRKTLLSISNIIAVQLHTDNERAVILYKSPIDNYNSKKETVAESYDTVIALIKQAQ